MLPRLLSAGAALLLAGPALGQQQPQANSIFFPPQASADGAPAIALTVRAGDLLNVTWATAWDQVDLHLEASAPQSNFTPSLSFNSGLPGTGFLAYRLEPRDFGINDSALGIEAFYRVVDRTDPTESAVSQNFTINQPDTRQVSGIPADASTWTGSVTLYTSAGGAAVTSVPPGATLGAVQAKRDSPTAQPAPTSTSTASPAAPASGPSQAARVGIGIGAAAGVVALCGLGLAFFIVRRRRKLAARPQPLRPPALPRSGTLAAAKRSATLRMPTRARTAGRGAAMHISKPSMIHRVAFDGSTGTWGPAPPHARFAPDEKPKPPAADAPQQPRWEMSSHADSPHEMYAGPLSARTIGELPAVSSPRVVSSPRAPQGGGKG